jgi:hypothetical protein
LQGARAVQTLLAECFPGADVSVSVVWINMLEADSPAAAQAAAALVGDPRARHFYDPDRRAGRAIAESIGGRGQVAWDMYLFYPAGGEWRAAPPQPATWAHQLAGEVWAGPGRYRGGGGLLAALCAAMRELDL